MAPSLSLSLPQSISFSLSLSLTHKDISNTISELVELLAVNLSLVSHSLACNFYRALQQMTNSFPVCIKGNWAPYRWRWIWLTERISRFLRHFARESMAFPVYICDGCRWHRRCRLCRRWCRILLCFELQTASGDNWSNVHCIRAMENWRVAIVRCAVSWHTTKAHARLCVIIL